MLVWLATPALAVPETNPESLERHPEQTWVLITGEADEAPSPPPAQIVPPPKPSLPPPGEVLDAVSVLHLSCPKWQIGPTPGYETEAHVYRLLAGNDTAYADGAVAGSWMTAAFLGGLWLLFVFVLRLPDRLSAMVRSFRPWSARR
jgi:hypothetical protein